MSDNIFENYATLLKNNNPQKKYNYDENYFKNFYLKKLPHDKKSKILDLGCGNGKYLHVLNKFGYKNAKGIDISKEQIEIAKKNNLSNVECINAIDFLKKNSEKYDVVILIDVLEHLELNQSIELINLAFENLNKGGKLFIQVPNALAPFSPLRHADITHHRAYTKASLIQTLNMTNFEKLTFFELHPYIHGIKSFIRNILWRFLLKPLISAFLYTAYGTNCGKIYTANLLCVCEK